MNKLFKSILVFFVILFLILGLLIGYYFYNKSPKTYKKDFYDTLKSESVQKIPELNEVIIPITVEFIEKYNNNDFEYIFNDLLSYKTSIWFEEEEFIKHFENIKNKYGNITNYDLDKSKIIVGKSDGIFITQFVTLPVKFEKSDTKFLEITTYYVNSKEYKSRNPYKKRIIEIRTDNSDKNILYE